MMKLLKYIFIVAGIGIILVSVLTRVPAVQDRLMLRFVQTLGSSTADLNDNSLSAVVCAALDLHFHLQEGRKRVS